MKPHQRYSLSMERLRANTSAFLGNNWGGIKFGECMLDGTASEALTQIRENGYLTPYAVDPRKKMAVGISFSSMTRQVANYLVEEW